MSTLFMSLLQARRNLERHIDSQHLLHELLILHRSTRRSLEGDSDWVSPSGPNV
ncbi:hypothetical protein RYX36_010696 [Vicia faba]